MKKCMYDFFGSCRIFSGPACQYLYKISLVSNLQKLIVPSSGLPLQPLRPPPSSLLTPLRSSFPLPSHARS
jgi:hypothetical protein